MNTGRFFGGLMVMILQIILISCNNTVSKKSAEDYPVIKLDYHNPALSSIPEFSKIRFIPLETRNDVLIGAIDKIIVTENRFFVLDAFSAEGVS
jgi:6-bladed beta-propeller